MPPSESEVDVAGARVERWPTEVPLTVLVALAAAAIWVLLVVSIIGIVYALLLGVFFFAAHVAFIAYLRGSAVRLGPDQMPELHARVEDLAHRLGLRRPPAAYVMQAGGSLNALATRLFATDFIVLFSDLLDACGDNTEARDFILAHELGHLKAGHMRWLWFLMPGFLVPFLGSACSRAREYTSDRYGLAVARDRGAALRGLAILAAGGARGPQVNLAALTRQREDLNFGWMTLGTWLAGHPPLAERLVALEPSLGDGRDHYARGGLRALALITVIVLVPSAAGVLVVRQMLPAFQEAMAEAQRAADAEAAAARTPEGAPVADPERRAHVQADLARLRGIVEEHRARHGTVPAGLQELREYWASSGFGDFPIDPFDGAPYGYDSDGERFVLWSAGPDRASQADDIAFWSENAGE